VSRRSAWQILVIGFLGLYVWLLQTIFAPYVPALIAAAMVAAVVVGFCFHPDRDSWTVWISEYRLVEGADDLDLDLLSTKDVLSFRVNLRRLWLLFIPTLCAVAFLVLRAARGRWHIEILDGLIVMFPFFGVMWFGLATVWFLLSGWVFERWLLRRADACEGEIHTNGTYHFVVNEEYFGGRDLRIGRFTLGGYASSGGALLSGVVLFRRKDPRHNRRIPSFIFHRFDIVGRGIEDLERARQRGERLQAANWAGQGNA
jgi:hypothetical protein